jgi:hypothetical protein
LAQNMQVGPCTPAGMQILKVEVGPTPGPTRRLSHLSKVACTPTPYRIRPRA